MGSLNDAINFDVSPFMSVEPDQFGRTGEMVIRFVGDDGSQSEIRMLCGVVRIDWGGIHRETLKRVIAWSEGA